MEKIRGFEKISQHQYNEDFKELKKLGFILSEIKLPKRSTALSAGYDVFCPITVTLAPGEIMKIPTGIRSYMQNDEVLKAYPRSGHGFKYFLKLANTVGIIDADYYNANNEGHFWVKLKNEGDIPCTIEAGQGMCQVIFEKYLLADEDSFEGDKRIGGFGSTDK